MAKNTVFLFFILLMGCNACSRDKEIRPISTNIEGANFAFEVSKRTIKISAITAGFETNVKIKKLKSAKIESLSLELLDEKGVPTNGWKPLKASSKDIEKLNNSSKEEYITFSIEDSEWLMVLLAELIMKNERGVKDAIYDKKNLERKLKESDIEKFKITGTLHKN